MKKYILFFILIFVLFFTASCDNKTKDYDIKDYRVEMAYHDDFKIMPLGDLHFGQLTDVDQQYKFLTHNILEGNPDLIVLNGDNFFSSTKREVKHLFNFIDSFKIPWVYLQGNHDHQGLYGHNYVEKYISKTEYCINVNYTDDNIVGEENFYIDLMDGNDLIYRLFMLDSGSYLRESAISYTYGELDKTQIEHVQKIQANETDPSYISMAFFHITVNEMYDAIAAYKEDPSIGFGDFREHPCPTTLNNGQFTALKEAGISVIVNAHDHINCGAIKYDGVIMNYILKSTDQIYHDDDLLGYELMTLPRASFDINDIAMVFHTYGEVINNGK